MRQWRTFIIGAQKCTVFGPTGLFQNLANPLCSACAVAVLCSLLWNGVRMEVRNVGAAPARAAPKRRTACRAGIVNVRSKADTKTTDNEQKEELTGGRRGTIVDDDSGGR